MEPGHSTENGNPWKSLQFPRTFCCCVPERGRIQTGDTKLVCAPASHRSHCVQKCTDRNCHPLHVSSRCVRAVHWIFQASGVLFWNVFFIRKQFASASELRGRECTLPSRVAPAASSKVLLVAVMTWVWMTFVCRFFLVGSVYENPWNWPQEKVFFFASFALFDRVKMNRRWSGEGRYNDARGTTEESRNFATNFLVFANCDTKNCFGTRGINQQ